MCLEFIPQMKYDTEFVFGLILTIRGNFNQLWRIILHFGGMFLEFTLQMKHDTELFLDSFHDTEWPTSSLEKNITL